MGKNQPLFSRAQRAVIQKLGIQKVYAVIGFSMGGQQV
jgi:homoserine acetyltransferase